MLWAGSPDCDAGHSFLLQALKACTGFLPKGTSLTERRKGNLGEFAALNIGKQAFQNCLVIAANAHNPLSDISRSDIDLMWLGYGASSQDDFAVVQEVKTTVNASLSYANELIRDYDKLFNTDPLCTLQSRCGYAANVLAGFGYSTDVICRTRALGGISATTSPKIRLCPTLVHEKNGADPTTKLLAVRSTIIGAGGWNGSAVRCWSISLENLEQRFARLSWGE